MSKRDLAGFEEKELTVSAGARLRYFVGGAGPPLALVHGLGGMATNWRLVAPALATEHRVVVPDLPGHGRSGPLDVDSLACSAGVLGAIRCSGSASRNTRTRSDPTRRRCGARASTSIAT